MARRDEGRPVRHGTWLAAAVALLVAAFYLPSAGFQFVWDDAQLVAPNPALRDAAGLARGLGTDLYRAADPSLQPTPYWRPAVLASWYLNTRLPGPPERALHIGNALLHTLAAALLFLLLRRLAGAGPVVSAVLALWWALHPLVVEPVAWISGRYDLLTGVAVLALFLLPAEGARGALARAVMVAVGLGSKEGFVVLPAALAAWDWASRRRWRAVLPGWLAMGAVAVAWWGARAALDIGSPGAARFSLRGYLSTVAVYLQRAVAPLPLSTGTPFAPSAAMALGGAVLCGIAVVVVVRRREAAAPVALLLAPLVPASVAVAEFDVVAERYAYVPLLGLAWLVAIAVEAVKVTRPAAERWATALVGVLAAFGAASSALRLPDWRDDRRLFEAALRVDPGDWMARLNLATQAITAGDLDAALAHLETARERNPRSGMVANAIADVQHRRGDGPAMLAAAKRAVELSPDLPQARLRLATAYRLTGDYVAQRAELDAIGAHWPDWRWPAFLREVARCEAEPWPACGAGLQRIAASKADEAAPALEALALAALDHGDRAAANAYVARLKVASPNDPRVPLLERRIGAAAGR